MALVATTIAFGAVWGGIAGNFFTAIRLSAMVAIGLGAAATAFAIWLRFCFPERETIVDWGQGTIRLRNNWRMRTYPLANLSKICVVEQRLNDNTTTASLQLMVAGESIDLLYSDGCANFAEACSSIVHGGERLAEACGVEFELPVDINRDQMPTVSGRQLAQGYLQAGRSCIASMESAHMQEDDKEAEKFRNRAIDYFALANQCDPAFADPLLEIAQLSPDDAYRQEVVELALTADATSSQALVERAELYHKQGHGKLAEADYRAAIQMDRCAANLRARSNFYRAQGNFDAAIADLTDAIALNDNSTLLPQLLDARASCYRARYEETQSKDLLQRAICDWRQAVELAPDMIVSPDCLLHDIDTPPDHQ